MQRHLLPPDRVHPAAIETIGGNHREVVDEALAAIENHPWVILGMAQNPVVKKARKLLNDAGETPHYIEHGSYLKEWRKRNALKMWTGWPTFPMVFHDGTLLGGANELAAYLKER